LFAVFSLVSLNSGEVRRKAGAGGRECAGFGRVCWCGCVGSGPREGGREGGGRESEAGSRRCLLC